MKYTRIASSRTGSTDLYQPADASLPVVEVRYCKSGRIDYCPFPAGTTGVDRSLTVQYNPSADDAQVWETDPVTEAGWLPAQR